MYATLIRSANDEQEQCNKRGRASPSQAIACRYFIQGFCHFGKNCLYSHEKKDIEAQRPAKVCRYYLQGTCTFGDKCFYQHTGIQQTETTDSKVDEMEDICNICHDSPSEVKKVVGLLDCCDHCFCIDCITQWRQKGKASNNDGNHYSCPVCRRECSLILRSASHLKGDQREKYFNNFKEKAAQKQCADFQKNGKCKRGHRCLYKHIKPSGEDAKPQQQLDFENQVHLFHQRELRRNARIRGGQRIIGELLFLLQDLMESSDSDD